MARKYLLRIIGDKMLIIKMCRFVVDGNEKSILYLTLSDLFLYFLLFLQGILWWDSLLQEFIIFFSALENPSHTLCELSILSALYERIYVRHRLPLLDS